MRSMSLNIFHLEAQDISPDWRAVRRVDGEPGKTYFDSAATLAKLKQTFPDVIIDEEDKLLAEAKRAESFFAGRETENTKRVIESLYEKANNFGPAIAFSIPTGEAQAITGSVGRYAISFIYGEAIPASSLVAILKFLQSFGLGEVTDRIWHDRRHA